MLRNRLGRSRNTRVCKGGWGFSHESSGCPASLRPCQLLSCSSSTFLGNNLTPETRVLKDVFSERADWPFTFTSLDQGDRNKSEVKQDLVPSPGRILTRAAAFSYLEVQRKFFCPRAQSYFRSDKTFHVCFGLTYCSVSHRQWKFIVGYYFNFSI